MRINIFLLVCLVTIAGTCADRAFACKHPGLTADALSPTARISLPYVKKTFAQAPATPQRPASYMEYCFDRVRNYRVEDIIAEKELPSGTSKDKAMIIFLKNPRRSWQEQDFNYITEILRVLEQEHVFILTENNKTIKAFNLAKTLSSLIYLIEANDQFFIIKKAVLETETLKLEYEILSKLNPHGEILNIAYPVFFREDFLVTNYFPGPDLAERIYPLQEKTKGPADIFLLSAEESLTLGLNIAEILTAMHANKIIYRDLKPDNIIVDKTLAAYFFDFNASMPFDYDWARDPLLLRLRARGDFSENQGPKRGRSFTPDEQTDIFSLGKILLFGHSGQSDPDEEKIQNISLKNIIARAVSSRESRYATLEQMITDMKQAQMELSALAVLQSI